MSSSYRLRWLPVTSVLAALAAFLPAQENLELGKMWTFENPPLAYLEEEYGFKPDQKWLNTVMLASLRFGRGCSASFVSPKGLIMTNHHCVRGNMADAQGDEDWVADGFVAASYEDEVRLPGLTVQQLARTTDVTARINEGVKEDDSGEVIAEKRRANQEKVLAEAEAQEPRLEAQVVSLFQGAIYQLYQYRVYDDIRLVVAPHLQAAHFGGDPDNFCYPRFGIDFSFCRAYVDGEPADTSEHYFRWSNGAVENQMVILTGNPGGTRRLLTKAQLEYLRDAYYPRVRQLIDNRLRIMRAFAEQSDALEKRLRTTILSYENGQKLYRGEHGALQDSSFMARKEQAEAAFRNRVKADEELEREYGSLWSGFAEVAAAKTALEMQYNFQTTGGSPHLIRAVAVVRAASGDEAEAEKARGMPVQTDPLQQEFFVDHLERATRWLPADDPYLAVALDGRTPREAAERIASESRIGDDEFVTGLLAAGEPAVRASDDVAIRIARVLVPLIDSNREAWSSVEAKEGVLGTRIAQALFEVYGNAVSPDATFTLRFSDGRVKGYEYNGTLAPYRTVFYGMFARNAEFDDRYPFNLPELWKLRRDRLDMRAAVNFVCTVDSTGGNSGSPVINEDMQIVGLLFDGNIESLGNEFLYSQRVERSVCVHPQAIMEALTKVYDAHRVARELWNIR